MKMGWQTKNLGEVLKIQNGYAFDSKKFNPSDGLPLVRIRSLKAGEETETRYSGDYDKKYLVRAGDLLVGMDGEFGCYEWKGEPALLNQRVCRLQDFSKEIVPRFLFYGLNDYLKAIEDVTGFATVKHLSSKQILAIEFPVPPLPEQQRIVAKLDEAFEGIATAKENAERNVKNARAIFESELNAIFTKERNEKWPIKLLGNVCDFEGGSQPPKSQFSYAPKDGYVRFLQIRDFGSDKHITFIPESKKNRLCNDSDVMIGRYGASVGKILTGRAGAYNVALMKTIPNPAHLDTSFLYQYLLSGSFQQRLAKVAARSAQNGFSKEDIYEFPVPVPPFHEQKQLVKALNGLRAEIQRLASIYQRKITALDALKKSLLHHAFTGQL